MADPIQIVELLTSYGGWGVAALSIAGNVLLLRYIKKQHAERLKEKSVDNERALSQLEKRVEVDHKHAIGYEKLTAVVKQSNELSSKMLEKL